MTSDAVRLGTWIQRSRNAAEIYQTQCNKFVSPPLVQLLVNQWQWEVNSACPSGTPRVEDLKGFIRLMVAADKVDGQHVIAAFDAHLLSLRRSVHVGVLFETIVAAYIAAQQLVCEVDSGDKNLENQLHRPSRYTSNFLCALLRNDAEACWARIELELGYETFTSMVHTFGDVVDRPINEDCRTHGVTNLNLQAGLRSMHQPIGQ